MRIPWQSKVVFTGGLGLLFFQTGEYWSATWLSKWMFLITLLAVGFAIHIARKTCWLYLPLLLYALGSLIALGFYPQSPYQHTFDPLVVMAFQKNALSGLAQFVGLALIFSWVDRKASLGIGAFLSAVWAIGVAGFLLLPSSGIHSAPNNGMWFGNPSMGASLLACVLPAAWGFQHWGATRLRDWKVSIWAALSSGLTLWVICKTRASAPWGVLGVVTAAFMIDYVPRRTRVWGIAAILCLAAFMITLGQNYLGHDFWDQNGRFEIWRMAWGYFWAHAHPSVGFGYSSTQVLLPIEQIVTQHFHGDYFLWLHNDWLQLALEGGYVGMFCVFLALFRLVAVSWKYPALFASLMGFVTLGLFNYPLRMPLHCLCLVLVCGLAESGASFARRSPS